MANWAVHGRWGNVVPTEQCMVDRPEPWAVQGRLGDAWQMGLFGVGGEVHGSVVQADGAWQTEYNMTKVQDVALKTPHAGKRSA